MSATFTCPQGHESHDPEWCDVCGARLGAAPVNPPTPDAPDGPPATGQATQASPAATVACPNCRAINEAGNLFCEECGYDFTTGQAPQGAPAEEASPDEEPVGGPTWVVVVEVDPQWYALKGSLADTPCPPASTHTVTLHGRTTLIGRTSSSRAVHPDIALDQDTGVSRRHAQLVNDGATLTIVDLASTNGTFVVAGGDQPDDDTAPLAADETRTLADGDRVYLGAWTRLTLRHP